jgi:hypothetical protein
MSKTNMIIFEIHIAYVSNLAHAWTALITRSFDIPSCDNEPSDDVIGFHSKRKTKIFRAVDGEVIVGAKENQLAVRTNIFRRLTAKAAAAPSRNGNGIFHF